MHRICLGFVLCLLVAGSASAATPNPNVTVTVPATPLIGDALTLTVSFNNTSADETGYGPYVDLFLPATGVDGNSGVPDDGINFASATYLGAPLVSIIVPLTATGVNHPYAKLSSGLPRQLILADFPGAKVGDQVVVIQMPYGSFTPAQPTADITVGANLSNNADLERR